MENQICLRCNLPISRERGCICTSPNWRIYDPSEQEYLKPSTSDLPLKWLTTFMDRREIFRFRGAFFAPALNNPENILEINENENTFDVKVNYEGGTPKPSERHHYSSFLGNILSSQVKQSLQLMRDKLSTCDKEQGRHLLYTYLKNFETIEYNMRMIQRPSDQYDALEYAFLKLVEFFDKEKLYYFKDEIPKWQNRDSSKESDEKNKKKPKVSEKWYALLHMIYVKMRRVEKFENISDKKSIMDYGKDNYPFKGTGQMFYKYIRIINKHRIQDYIFYELKKDRKKWIKTIIELSGNDPEVKEWIDTNK